MFVTTSVAIGVVGFVHDQRYNVIRWAWGFWARASFVFDGSILLIFEARLALSRYITRMEFHMAALETSCSR